MSATLRFDGPGAFDALEAAFADLRDAFGALVVARHRGQDVVERERSYGADRVAVERAVASFGHLREAGAVSAELGAIRSTLAWMDELEPVDGLAAAGFEPLEPADVAGLRRRTMETYAEAAERVDLGRSVVDRPTALGLLATEPDPARRRRIFEALAPVWQAVDGDGGPASPYRMLLRSSAARWDRDGSPIEAAATALGMAPGSIEGTLREVLAAWRRVLGGESIEPWDYRYAAGALERRLGGLVPRDRLRAINDAHLRSLGADPEPLRIHYDIEPRDGRPPIPVAFAIAEDVCRPALDGTWTAATPWVFATYEEGGLGNLEELLHESGHAIHYAAIRARPALFEPPVEAGGLVEGLADLVGWDVHEPAFQALHLGRSAGPRECRLGRYGGVMLDVCWALFELELHRSPDRRPNDVWAELAADGLGIVPHPEWSWWAVRGQLVESPGYMANYALSAILAAAFRARIREVRGDWLAGDGYPGWYAFLSDAVLRFGAARPAADVVRDFLDGPLTADPLLGDLRGISPD